MHQNGYLGYQIFINFPEDNAPICQIELCDPPTYDAQLTPKSIPPSTPPSQCNRYSSS